jgi:uncharacterized alkaline shock family protein YloU
VATSKKAANGSGLHLEGVDVAPGVLDTIVLLAAEGVEGVACVGSPGISGLVPKGSQKSAVDVTLGEDGGYVVTLHLAVSYGKPIRAVAADVQEAVADALLSQTGVAAANVDVFVDSIDFPE